MFVVIKTILFTILVYVNEDQQFYFKEAVVCFFSEPKFFFTLRKKFDFFLY